MSADPGDLERGWRLVESKGTPGADILAAEPVIEQPNSPMVGVDALGARHLLIPIADDDEVAETTGAAVTLKKRRLVLERQEQSYADLACTRPDLFDEFAVLAAEIIAALDTEAADPAQTAARVVHDWRELLRALAPPQLDRRGVIGLFAELSVLNLILERDPRRTSEAWTGPSRSRYDFQRADTVLEVKGSTARRGRPIHVHGLDQLALPPNGRLYLCWVRVEVGIDRGESLRDLVERLLNRVSDPVDLEQKLTHYGYDFSTAEMYETPRLTELERRTYLVDDAFPTLTHRNLVGGELPHGVLAVEYDIDLSGDRPTPLTAEENDLVLRRLAGVT